MIFHYFHISFTFCPSCSSNTPIPFLLDSTDNVTDLFSLNYFNYGACIIISFIRSMSLCVLSFHIQTESFFSYFNARVKIDICVNFVKYDTISKKFYTFSLHLSEANSPTVFFVRSASIPLFYNT